MASDSIVAETATRIFRDLCDPQTVNRAADESWTEPAWTALEEAGLTLAWVPDELGGAGADVADGFAVLREAGRFAVALPVAETMLAGWLLARGGISSPRGAMSCGPTRDGDRLTLTKGGTLAGRLRAVPFAAGAKHIAVLAEREGGGTAVALVETGAVRIADGANIAGDALNAVIFDGAQPVAVKRRARRPRRRSAPAHGRHGAGHADGGRAGSHSRCIGQLRQRARGVRTADRQVPGRAAQPRAAGRRDGRRHGGCGLGGRCDCNVLCLASPRAARLPLPLVGRG